MSKTKDEHGTSGGAMAAWVAAIAIGIGCATSPDEGRDVRSETNAAAPEAKLPPTSAPVGGGAPGADAGPTPKDAGKKGDAAVDGAVPTAVVPGAACPLADAIVSETCGACGTREAICVASRTGPGGTWSDFGACTGEVEDGCTAGTIVTEACGNCGTLTRTCSAYCEWDTPACVEPPNACTPYATGYTTAGCPAGGYRRRTCTASCAWGTFAPSCSQTEGPLVVAPTVGGTVSGIYP